MSSHSASPPLGRSSSSERKTKSSGGGKSSGDDGSGGNSSGGSKSPSGRVRGRDREKRRDGSPKRGSKNKKLTGPADWTREELFDRIRKFGTLKLDRGSGSGTLEAVNRRIMPDDAIVICEIFRRYTEVQSVTLQRCFLTDDTFALLSQNMPNLRHLKHLNLTFNSLSSPSVVRIVALYNFIGARPDRRIEEIDLRNNNLNVHDGQALYDAFPTIRILNGIRLLKHRRDTMLHEIDLCDASMRITEVKILAGLLKALSPQHIYSINLSRNKINCRGLRELTLALGEVAHVRFLDISHNPLTDGDLDFTGIESIISLVRTSKWLCNLKRDGVTGFTPLQEQQLERSLQVNRSLDTLADDAGIVLDKFASYIRSRMEKTVAALPPIPKREDMDPTFNVDYAFCRLNRIPERIVDVSQVRERGHGFTLAQKYDLRAPAKALL